MMLDGLIVVLDFDGVLHTYHKWEGVVPCNPPVDGAREFVAWLVENGAKVKVSSTRALEDGGADAIRLWLQTYSFPPMPITSEKPIGHLYIDDRGWRFEGDFSPIKQYILHHPHCYPWSDHRR